MLQVGCVARSEKHVNQITQHKDIFLMFIIYVVYLLLLFSL